VSDEDYIRERRRIESLSKNQLGAELGLAEDGSPDFLRTRRGHEDFFAPPAVDPVSLGLLTSIRQNMTDDGVDEKSRARALSMLVPMVVAASISARKRRENRDTPFEFPNDVSSKLTEIGDKLRRMMGNAE
jgi:hypothetical protein